MQTKKTQVFNRVPDQNVVVMSLLTPSTTKIDQLKEKVLQEKDLQLKCQLYEEILNEKLGNRAIKIWGVFINQEEAKKYITTELSEFKHYHLLLCDTHEWTVLDESFSENKEYLDAELSELLENHMNIQKKEEDAIKQRIEKTKIEMA
jgi:hypothetical protein